MSLQRAVFLHDDLVFGCYDDDTSILLHVPDETFSVLDAYGKLIHAHRVLKFAVKCVRAKLRLLLRFRNFCSRNVYLCPHLLEGMPVELDVPVEYLRWPASVREEPRVNPQPQEATMSQSCEPSKEHYHNHQASRITGPSVVTSLDNLAEVFIPAHGRLMRVAYPALIGKKAVVDDSSPTPRSRYKYHYARVSQLFLTNDHIPDSWHHAISLAGRSIHRPRLPQGPSTQYVSSRLPTLQTVSLERAVNHRRVQGAPSRRQKLERVFRAFHSFPEKLSSFRGENQSIRAVWTPEATFLVPSGCQGVETLVHVDDSLVSLRANGLIFDHFADETCADATRVFPVNSIPLKLTARGDETNRQTHYLHTVCSLASEIFHHNASKLRDDASISSLEENSSGSVSTTATQFSSTVHMAHTAPEIGVFTAFKDGRVRVRFLDRTLLELQPPRTHYCGSPSVCNFVLPDGKSCAVSTDRPLDLAWHVQQATQFRDYAFTSQKQRAQLAKVAHANRAAMDLEMRKTGRFLHIQRLSSCSK